MGDFIGNLSSLGWWLSVVVVGVLVNYISTRLNPSLDGFFGKLSGKWRSRSLKQRQRWQGIVDRLIVNPDDEGFFLASEIRSRIQGNTYLLQSIIFLLFSLFIRFSAQSTQVGIELLTLKIAVLLTLLIHGLLVMFAAMSLVESIGFRQSIFEARRLRSANAPD